MYGTLNWSVDNIIGASHPQSSCVPWDNLIDFYFMSETVVNMGQSDPTTYQHLTYYNKLCLNEFIIACCHCSEMNMWNLTFTYGYCAVEHGKAWITFDY